MGKRGENIIFICIDIFFILDVIVELRRNNAEIVLGFSMKKINSGYKLNVLAYRAA